MLKSKLEITLVMLSLASRTVKSCNSNWLVLAWPVKGPYLTQTCFAGDRAMGITHFVGLFL